VRTPLHVCLIASSRFPVGEPFMGGLEAQTHALATSLVRAGHQVSLFAAQGSDPDLAVTPILPSTLTLSDAARADIGCTPESWMREHHAYLGLMLALAQERHGHFDVVHNNSLHHLPVAMSSFIEPPVITTLHTPPLPWLESAVQLAPESSRFVAVSDSVSRSWRHAVRSTTVPNGVDTDVWRLGAGGDRPLWFGRLVPEKAPHEALLAAHSAGRPLDLAGPVHDPEYFETKVLPLLRSEDRYLGHLDGERLRRAVGEAEVVLVTPCWDEPFGLVAVEAMACGTPVAAYDRGALGEVVDEASGVLVPGGDIEGLGHAIVRASSLDRNAVRRRAVQRFSIQRMVDGYLCLYRELAGLPEVA
jgi:glycosyltransferase involved in cell wall biosynthesis